MKEERMFILNMINEGKITPQEGEALLKALNCGNMEKIEGIGAKVMDFAKENKPRMCHAAHNLAEKSADVMENVGKAIKEKTAPKLDLQPGT